jgi:hypothetical protein
VSAVALQGIDIEDDFRMTLTTSVADLIGREEPSHEDDRHAAPSCFALDLPFQLAKA